MLLKTYNYLASRLPFDLPATKVTTRNQRAIEASLTAGLNKLDPQSEQYAAQLRGIHAFNSFVEQHSLPR